MMSLPRLSSSDSSSCLWTAAVFEVGFGVDFAGNGFLVGFVDGFVFETTDGCAESTLDTPNGFRVGLAVFPGTGLSDGS